MYLSSVADIPLHWYRPVVMSVLNPEISNCFHRPGQNVAYDGGATRQLGLELSRPTTESEETCIFPTYRQWRYAEKSRENILRTSYHAKEVRIHEAR